MAVANRQFGFSLAVVAIYANQSSGVDLSTATPLANLISVFTDCKLRFSDENIPGRATSEDWDYPLPISTGWTITVGQLLDSTLPQLSSIRITDGRGPFCVWIKNGSGIEFNGRALIGELEWAIGDNAQTESCQLIGQGALVSGHITS